MRGSLRAVALCSGILALAAPARAQVGAGQITGLVRDQTGSVVSGATVTVTETSRNLSRSVVSQEKGDFTFASLAPGQYRLAVTLDRFRPLSQDGIEVRTGETVDLGALELSLGAPGEAVTVTAALPVVRTVSGSLGQVVSNQLIVGLPLNGRLFVTLSGLAPGVALPPGSLLPRINGGRPRTNEYLFDGISVLQPEPGQVAYFPVIDAIQEFKIESNSPPAEFGRFNGGVINLTTKEGGNAFHGSAFGFWRNEVLNARNYFQSTIPEKPEFRRTQGGFTFGGPIKRDRTFFFADYQGQRQDIARTAISTVPTLNQRKGIFTERIYDPATLTPDGNGGFTRAQFDNNSIPKERMDSAALALLNRYPLPTGTGTANNFRRTALESDDQDQWEVKITQKFTDRDQAFGRLTYFRDDFLPVTPLPDGSGTPAGALGNQATDAWAFASNYQRTISERLLNEFRFGQTARSVLRDATSLSGPPSATLGIPGIPTNAQFPTTLPSVTITGLTALGSPLSTASDFSTSVTEVADSLTWLRGHHTFKMGFDWRWERLNVVQPGYPTGLFNFTNLFTDLPGTAGTGSAVASFLLGQVQNSEIDLQQKQIRNRAHFQEYFFQDTWRLNDRWTISPGLRYTLNFPSTEVDNQVAVFNLETQKLDVLGQDGNPESARRLHWGDFGPRLSAAGQLTDTFVLSAGYARVMIEMAGITTPFTTPTFPYLQAVTQRTLDNRIPAFVLSQGPSVVPVEPGPYAGLGQGVFAVTEDLGSGYVQQWNVALQRQLGRTSVVEVAYVGSSITRVGLPDANVNQLTVDQLALGPVLQERVPNPFFGEIPRSSSLGDPTITRAQLMKAYPKYTTVSLYRDNAGNTRYHGLTVRFEQRYSHGFTYLASYTRSKLIDDASSVFDASILTGPPAAFAVADSFDRSRDRDYSTGDIPHVFAASGAWDIPWGRGRANQAHGWRGALVNDWSLTGILTLQSGVPVAVTQTNLNAFAGFGTQRPNLIGDPELPSGERTAQRWFNTAAFAQAPVFTLGTASRNPVRGPSYRNLDLAVSRRIGLPSSTSLEFRVEAFNALNTPPFNAPNGNFGSAAFGTITSAGDPRVIQLALKYYW
ncbi:MAG TPA: TonB-dependent receptor [Vicinamibacterales bacterium]|nr:TonB-dependent receptor [Vicinamibacterales bacterium]